MRQKVRWYQPGGKCLSKKKMTLDKKQAGSFIFKELTGMRAIAALLVYFHHFNPFAGTDLFFFDALVNELHIGVNFFFVLSGFLLWYRYYSVIEDSFRFSNLKTYLVNRFARIYPVYFLLTTLTFVVLYFFYEQEYSLKQQWVVYFLNITFLRGFFDSFRFSLITQGWSLTVEECFYFVLPFLILWNKRKMPMFLFALILPLIGVGLTLYFMRFGNFGLYGFFANWDFLFGFTIFGRFFEFFLGMVLANVFLKKKHLLKPIHLLWGAILVTLCLAVLAEIKILYNVQQGPFNNYGRFINNVILPIGVLGIYSGLISGTNWLKKMLSSDFCQLMGKASYAFYLLHNGVVHDAADKLTQGTELFNFLLLVLVSVVVYRFIEEPLNIKIRKVLR